MAITFRSGEQVGAGEYWDLYSGERVSMEREGRLPGDGEQTFTRLPTFVVLLLSPLAGLAFALFLPFIGIAAILELGARALFSGVSESVGSAASFNWRLSEAYLLGKETDEKEAKKVEEKKAEETTPGADDGGKHA